MSEPKRADAEPMEAVASHHLTADAAAKQSEKISSVAPLTAKNILGVPSPFDEVTLTLRIHAPKAEPFEVVVCLHAR